MRVGSSPRVRGADPLALVCVPQDGIIPACAGSSRCSPPRASCWGDHPRACGEQAVSDEADRDVTGSSPRVRGAAVKRPQQRREGGIIPARAGSRIPYEWVDGPKRDHPRAYGEQLNGEDPVKQAEGSSPRVRGAGLPAARGDQQEGIIPARAGSRAQPDYPRRYVWDHPRACGEQPGMRERRDGFLGSSPRVRGAGQGRRLRHGAGGIIPARAGSSRSTCRTSSQPWDHPRACGEQNPPVVVADGNVGSSPRVRGADVMSNVIWNRLGIIPARAGSSLTKQCKVSATRDHPRACGEQASATTVTTSFTGSSPRVRGAAEV